MATFREALSNAARLFLCGTLDEVANVYDIFSDLLNPLPGTQYYANIANAIRQVCNREPPPNPNVAPFTGGQCNTRYLVFTTMARTDGGTFSDTTGFTGTIKEYTATINGRIINARVNEFPPLPNPTTRRFTAQVFGGVTTPPGTDPGGTGSWQGVTNQITTPIPPGVGMRIVSMRLQRADGLPDNCGNPPPTPNPPPPPPNYNRTNTQITYQNNDGVNVTIPVGFFIAKAFLDANLNVNIPVYFTINNNISFPINFNIGTGDVNFNFIGQPNQPNGQPQLPPGGGGNQTTNNFDFELTTPPPPPPPGSESPDRPEQTPQEAARVIRGVIVTVTAVDTSALGTIFQTGGNPDIWVPDLGFVQFSIQIGNSVSWTNNHKVNNIRCFIPCPWDGGAISVAGTPRPGITWSLTPVYAKSGLPT